MDCGISLQTKPVHKLAQDRWQSHENQTCDPVRFSGIASKQNATERALDWFADLPSVCPGITQWQPLKSEENL